MKVSKQLLLGLVLTCTLLKTGAEEVEAGQAEEGGEGEGEEGVDDEKMAELMKMLEEQQAGMGGGMGGMGGMDFGEGMGGMDFGGMGGMDFGGMGGMGASFEGVKSDVKLILCDSCTALVDESLKQVETLRTRLPNTKISETRIDELLEKVCEPKESAGDWVSWYDMVEKDGRVVLEKQNGPGQCREECKTVQLACEKIMSEVGPDLVEMLYLKKPKETILQAVCTKGMKRFKGACGKPYPKVPETREPLGEFVPKTEQELAMDEINRKIRNTPGLGSMNPRDEL